MPEFFVWLHEFEANFRTAVLPNLHVNYGAFDFLLGRSIPELDNLAVDHRYYRGHQSAVRIYNQCRRGFVKRFAGCFVPEHANGDETAKRWLRRWLTNWMRSLGVSVTGLLTLVCLQERARW
jgi:hypothetical protein